MFTGLVERVGTITAVEASSATSEITITLPDDGFLKDASLGESISVSGACLTVTSVAERSFTAVAVEETLRRTTLGELRVGSRVNLERALLLTQRLGGHLVQGHVDGVARISGLERALGQWLVTLEPPVGLTRYIVEKGSVCLEGISLTVASVQGEFFSVAVIPHTREVTTSGLWEVGRVVNLETDIIAKYVERLTGWVPLNQELRAAPGATHERGIFNG
jgi:riboflavin synthase